MSTGNPGAPGAAAPEARFGFWTLCFLVVANMVGAGVFTTSGFTLAELGSPGRVVAAWAVGGGVALAGAASYGQLVRAMPESGGEYLFLSRAAHPLLGFVAGWVSLIAGFTGAIAFAATAFESYAVPAGARPGWLPENAVALGVVALAAASHGLRPRVGAGLQNLAVGLKLALLAGFLAWAAVSLPGDGWQGGPVPGAAPAGGALAVAFAGSLVWISLSYSGFNAAVYVAEECERPRDTIPRALVCGTAIATALYVALNAAFVYAPPPEAVAGAPDVAAVAAEWMGGRGLATFVRVLVSIALFTSVSSMMMAAPRVYAKMAEDGFLPAFLRRAGAPRRATWAQLLLAALFVQVSTLQGLLSYLGLTLSLSAACSVGCLFLPALRQGRSGLAQLAPALFLAATLLAAALLAFGNPLQLLGTALTFGVGAAAYFALGAQRGAGPLSGAA